MTNYRRLYVPNGTCFFTVATHARQPLLVRHGNIKRLYRALRYAESKRPFHLDALVILPDHLHCLWTMGADGDFSIRWQLLKTHFSRDQNRETHRADTPLWQKRFLEHLIRDEGDFRRHLDYIHYNPVKHGYVSRPAKWLHGIFQKFVARGWYEENLGSAEPEQVRALDQE